MVAKEAYVQQLRADFVLRHAEHDAAVGRVGGPEPLLSQLHEGGAVAEGRQQSRGRARRKEPRLLLIVVWWHGVCERLGGMSGLFATVWACCSFLIRNYLRVTKKSAL